MCILSKFLWLLQFGQNVHVITWLQILHVIMDHTYMCIDLFLYDDSGYGDNWRQVFTSDRGGVGVTIRSIE